MFSFVRKAICFTFTSSWPSAGLACKVLNSNWPLIRTMSFLPLFQQSWGTPSVFQCSQLHRVPDTEDGAWNLWAFPRLQSGMLEPVCRFYGKQTSEPPLLWTQDSETVPQTHPRWLVAGTAVDIPLDVVNKHTMVAYQRHIVDQPVKNVLCCFPRIVQLSEMKTHLSSQLAQCSSREVSVIQMMKPCKEDKALLAVV